jgi:hypothetical protein
VEAETVEVSVHVFGASDRSAVLVRSGDRWIGYTSDFPPGSVADVQPSRSPGFFIIHDPGGSFRALSNQSPHRGQPL